MPLIESEHLKKPEDPNAYIWRFMDLPKFLDILSSQTLYFRRADQFDDPCECMPPDDFLHGIVRSTDRDVSPHRWIRLFHHARCDTFLNCWHLSDHESYAMWKLYSGADAGIAIKSSFSRLKGELMSAEGDECALGLASYDVSTLVPDMNVLALAMHKRPHFQFENEVRAVVLKTQADTFFDIDSDEPLTEPLPVRPGPFGHKLAVNVQRLVMEVVLSPWSPSYLADILREVIEDFGFRIDVRVSTINKLSYVK